MPSGQFVRPASIGTGRYMVQSDAHARVASPIDGGPNVDIAKTYRIAAPRALVWGALTNPVHIETWSGAPAIMSDQPGTDFVLWDGDVRGRNLEVEPERRLVQEWYGGDWDEPSIATFTLWDVDGGGTFLELFHTNVPDDEGADFDTGWDDYYLGPMKRLLEAS